MRVIDLNADGRPDAIFANEGPNAVVMNIEGLPQRTLLPGVEDTYDLAVGDMNGDGLPDIGFANSDASNTLFFLKRSGDTE